MAFVEYSFMGNQRVIPVDSSEKSIFITGATGFIGKYLTRTLLSSGLGSSPSKLYILVRDKAKATIQESDGLRLLEGNLESLAPHKEVIHRCHYVFHLAARASIRGGEKEYLENVNGTKRLIECLRESPNLQRLIYTSSIGAVDRQLHDNCSLPIDEKSVPHPLTTYGKSKLEGERLLRVSGLPWVIVRPTWVYGPGMRSESHIRVFIRMARSSKFISRLAFPGRVSVIHVEDLVRALLLVAQNPLALREIFFASDGNPVSIGEIFDMLNRYLGCTRSRYRFPKPFVSAIKPLRKYLPFLMQNLFSDLLYADNTKIERLGFVSRIKFDRGLLHTLHWDAKITTSGKSQGTCLVTGAASGIGRSLSLQLYALGYDLLLVDKNEEVLTGFSEWIGMPSLCLDLCEETALKTIEEHFSDQNQRFSWLVNCAGVGIRGYFSDLPFESQKHVIQLNITALVFLTQLAVKHFKKNGGGVIVNVASSASFQPLPYMAVYSASKTFALHFSEAVWGELSPSDNIRLLVICPAGTSTNFQEAAGVKKLDGEALLRPEMVASEIISAVNRKRCFVAVGLRSKEMNWISRFLPRHFSVLMWRRLMEKMR